MNSKKKAFQLISEQLKDQLPFSLQYSWWNEVIQENWEVVTVTHDSSLPHNESNEAKSGYELSTIKAVWPIYVRKKGPWKMLGQPAFTPYGGPIYNYPKDQKRERRYSWEQKTTVELIQQLPEFSELLINCRIDLSNTLPFIWGGFEDRKKYTYLLHLQQHVEDIWQNFRENIRRQIRKAEKELTVSVSNNSSKMGDLLKESYANKAEVYPIDDETIYSRISQYIEKHSCGELLQAVDQKGEIHAMMVWIHDSQSAYYLIGGAAEKHKNSGAMSLLMWEAIQRSKAKGISTFNFEGSMVPSIEKYLRGFGGILSPYSCLIKNNSKSLQVLRKLKN